MGPRRLRHVLAVLCGRGCRGRLMVRYGMWCCWQTLAPFPLPLTPTSLALGVLAPPLVGLRTPPGRGVAVPAVLRCSTLRRAEPMPTIASPTEEDQGTAKGAEEHPVISPRGATAVARHSRGLQAQSRAANPIDAHSGAEAAIARQQEPEPRAALAGEESDIRPTA